jgi:alpha-amylase
MTHQLLQWVADMTQRYSLDGLRVDTTAEMPRGFLRAFSDAAQVFTMGEVFFTGLDRVAFVSSYAGPQALDSVLSYPMYGALRAAFGEQGDMRR